MKIAGVISYEETKFGPVLYKGGFKEHIRKLANFGYEGVEISLRDPSTIDKEKLKKVLEEEKIELASVATGQAALKDNLTFTDSDEKIREKAIERIMQQIEFASEFSAPVILGLIRGNLPDDREKREEAVNWSIDACRRCCDFAEKKGVKVLIELINRYEVNWLNNVKEGLDFLKKVKRDNLFLHIDTFHMNIEEPSFEKSILEAGSLIGYVHLVDSNRWAPGYGHINFKEIISALKKVDYRGYVALEVFPLPDPDTAAKKGIENARRLLAAS